MVKPAHIKDLSAPRKKIAELVESQIFVYAITALIVTNAISLGFETDPEVSQAFGHYLGAFDFFVLIIFTIELSLKFYAYRFKFFFSSWNNFDFIIIAISWLPTAGFLSVLRAFRILRVLRLLSIVPQMRRVISALGHSIPGIMSILGVLSIIFYVSSVVVTKLFGYDHDPSMQAWFGSVGKSAYTLFQIMTLESWSMGIVRPTMDLYPLAWLFFVPFIILTSFAVLNLFIGIIVDALQIAQKDPRQEDVAKINNFTSEDTEKVINAINALQDTLEEMTVNKKR